MLGFVSILVKEMLPFLVISIVFLPNSRLDYEAILLLSGSPVSSAAGPTKFQLRGKSLPGIPHCFRIAVPFRTFKGGYRVTQANQS